MPTVQAPRNAVRQQVSSAVRAPQGQADTTALDIGKVVTTGLGVFADVKNRMNTTAAEEAAVGFERDKNALFFNPENGYFNTQGRNAFDGAEGVNASLAALRKQYAEGLESPDAKRMFNKVANAHITRAGTDIMRHASKGAQAWEVATIESQVENSVENASLYHNQPDKMRVQRALGRQAVLKAAQMQGITGEPLNERLQNYESTFATAAISSATAVSADDGQQMLDDMIKRVEGPDIVRLQKAIASKTKQEKTQKDAQLSILMAESAVEEFDTITEALLVTENVDDPVFKKKLTGEIKSQWSTKKRAEKADSDAAYNAAVGEVNRGVSATAIAATDPVMWEAMTSLQRNNILSGKHMLTDQVLFNELMSKPTAVMKDLDVNDYSGQLKQADMEKLQRSIKSAQKGQSISTVQSLSTKTNAVAENFFGKKSSWRNRSGLTVKGKKANALMTFVQSTVQDAEELKGGRLTPREIDETMADITRKIVLERSAFGFDLLAPDTEIDLTNTPPNEVRALNIAIDRLGVDSTKDLLAVRQFLLDSNQVVTPNRLINTFRQGQ